MCVANIPSQILKFSIRGSFLWIAASLTLLAMTVLASPANACTCPPVTEATAQSAYMNADMIVEGEIIEVMGAWNAQPPAVRFNLTNIIKKSGKNKTINEDSFLANYNTLIRDACGHDFRVGQKIMVGVYDTSASPNWQIKGHGWRVVNACQVENLEFYLKDMLTE